MALYSLYLINKAGGLIYNVVRTTFLDMSPPLFLLLNSTVAAFVTSHAPSLHTFLLFAICAPFPAMPLYAFPLCSHCFGSLPNACDRAPRPPIHLHRTCLPPSPS